MANPPATVRRANPIPPPALSVSQQGKTRILTLRPAQVPAVRAALRRYHQAQGQLERQAAAGLRCLAHLQPAPSTH